MGSRVKTECRKDDLWHSSLIWIDIFLIFLFLFIKIKLNDPKIQTFMKNQYILIPQRHEFLTLLLSKSQPLHYLSPCIQNFDRPYFCYHSIQRKNLSLWKLSYHPCLYFPSDHQFSKNSSFSEQCFSSQWQSSVGLLSRFSRRSNSHQQSRLVLVGEFFFMLSDQIMVFSFFLLILIFSSSFSLWFRYIRWEIHSL